MEQGSELLLKHLSNLSADRKPVWGKMNAQQMVEHLGSIYLIASGQVEVSHLPEGEQHKNRAWFASDSFGFKPNTKSPILGERPRPMRFAHIDQALQALHKAIKAYHSYFEQNPSHRTMHPVFGLFTYVEWEKFHLAHNQHHLMQFHLMEE